MLECGSARGVSTDRLRRIGIPDVFIEHGERGELLADLQLDRNGVAAICREMHGGASNEVQREQSGAVQA